jgi:hypothetical protein
MDDDGDGVIDNLEELDRYSGVDREELVPLANGYWRAENERGFFRYERTGDGWRARSRDGASYEFGVGAAARIEDGSRVYRWLLERHSDLNGNVIQYEYETDPASPGQKYLRTIRWGQPTSFFSVVLTYDSNRPDVYSDYCSGFEVRTGSRVSRIDVVGQGMPASAHAITGDFNGDGTGDFLIRRYVLEYDVDADVSLLSRITQVGSDGSTELPATTLSYTSWTPPDNVAANIIDSAGDPTVGSEFRQRRASGPEPRWTAGLTLDRRLDSPGIRE